MEALTHAKQNIIALKDLCGSYKAMYEKIHGTPPTRRNTQTFTNNVNRGVYKAEFVIELIKAFNLHDITLGEFYFGDIRHSIAKRRNTFTENKSESGSR